MTDKNFNPIPENILNSFFNIQCNFGMDMGFIN